jgi:hypothetical protein
MNNRNLARELAQLDEEIEKLQLERTGVVLMIEVTAMLRQPTSNLIHFPTPSRITTRVASGEWLSRSEPSGHDRDGLK